MAKKKASKAQLGAGIQAVLGGNQRTAQETETLVKELSHSIAMLPLNKIFRNADQPRTDGLEDEDLLELTESIKLHGLIQPITVRNMADGSFQIISGERRWRASKLAGLGEIPVYIRIADDQKMMEMALVENIQREDLNPVELATSLARLKEEFNLTDQVVAQKIGKARPTVSAYLKILTLAPNIIESLRSGDISMGHAKELSGLDDRQLVQEFYSKTIENGWSVRALETAVKEAKEKLNIQKIKPKRPNLPSEYVNVLSGLRQKFGSKKVNIKLSKDGKGQIVLPFGSTEELNRILDIMDNES